VLTQVNGRRKFFYGATAEAVTNKLVPAQHAVRQGRRLPSDRLTVSAFLDQWLADIAASVKPTTHRSYSELVRLHLRPALGTRVLSRLEPSHVQALFTERLAAGHTPRRVQMMRDVLRAALNRAVRWELVSRNVASLAVAPRVLTREIVPLSPEGAADFLAAATGSPFEHLYIVLLTTGLRLGEALALGRADIDLVVRKLLVNHTLEWLPNQPWRIAEPKARSARRIVPLIAPAVSALRAQRATQNEWRLKAGEEWKDHGLLFTDALGEPLRHRAIHKEFKRIVRTAGLPSSHRPHDLRHTAATYLLSVGVATRVVMEILGHSTLAMTTRYQHVLSPMVTDAGTRLEGFFEQITEAR
jgi:integrase